MKRLHRDNGKEHGRHYTIIGYNMRIVKGYHRDIGKGYGNYDLGFRV